MDDISSSLILEKNELVYLVNCLVKDVQNTNASLLAEFVGVVESDDRKAVAGLIRKNIVSLADNRLVTNKLFDFYISKLLSADSVEILERKSKGLVLCNPEIIFLIKEHEFSETHVSIKAFRTRQELLEALEEDSEEL